MYRIGATAVLHRQSPPQYNRKSCALSLQAWGRNCKINATTAVLPQLVTVVLSLSPFPRSFLMPMFQHRALATPKFILAYKSSTEPVPCYSQSHPPRTWHAGPHFVLILAYGQSHTFARLGEAAVVDRLLLYLCNSECLGVQWVWHKRRALRSHSAS